MKINIGYHLSKTHNVPNSIIKLIDSKKFNLVIQSFIASPQSQMLPKSITTKELPEYTGIIHGKYLYNLNKSYLKQTNLLINELLLAKSINCPLVLHTKEYTQSQADQIVNIIKHTNGVIYIENNARVSILDFNTLVNEIHNKLALTPKFLDNFGIVIDLAHLYGSGDYDKLDTINWELVKVIHFNPSSVEYNSKKDRHLPIFPKSNLKTIIPVLNYIIDKIKKYNITVIVEKIPDNTEESQVSTIKSLIKIFNQL